MACVWVEIGLGFVWDVFNLVPWYFGSVCNLVGSVYVVTVWGRMGFCVFFFWW